jgi:hypothetical protein
MQSIHTIFCSSRVAIKEEEEEEEQIDLNQVQFFNSYLLLLNRYTDHLETLFGLSL